MSLPDFVIVGAMKCGTTTLAAQLAKQDGIFLTTPKEPNYFSDDDVFTRGEDWYRGLFDEARTDDLKGEASTHYTKLPTHPRTLARMQALLPDARIVYLIRNPVERAISHYIHEWSRETLRGTLDDAIETHPEIVDYGCYGMQIAPFCAAYGSDNVLLSSLETLTAEPDAELARIAAFLGHPGPVSWRAEEARQNVSSQRFRRLPMQGLLIDNPLAETLRRNLVPKSLRAWVRRTRSISTRPDVPEGLRLHLETVFAEDRMELAALFPDHQALDAAYPFLAPRRQAG